MDDCMDVVPEAEPTWIEKRRAERDIIIAPDVSREWDDRKTDPLTRDVAFNRHSMNDGHHVSPTDNAKVSVGTDDIRVALAQGIDEDALKRTLSTAVQATIGLSDVNRLPGDWEHCQAFCTWLKDNDGRVEWGTGSVGEFGCPDHDSHEHVAIAGQPHYRGRIPFPDWEEMLKGGLQTALETQVICFAVGGASRTATHQLVRSRRAAFHQQSQRASYMGDFPQVRMPESIWVNQRARREFLESTFRAWKAYQAICDEDISYQDARFVLPEGTANFILLEYPIREFLNVYAYRACSMFQWEIVHIMRECKRVLLEAHPWLEPYVKISCEKTGPATIATGQLQVCTCVMPGMSISHHRPGCPIGQPVTEQVEHHCTFQGWEDVEGQCGFPWAKDEARTFKPEHHRISRKA